MGGHLDEIAQRVVEIGIAMVLVMSLAACGRRHPATTGDAVRAGRSDIQLLARAAGARCAAEMGGHTLYVSALFAGPHGMERENPEPFDSMTQRRLSEAFVAGGEGQSVLFEPRAEGDSRRASHPTAVAITDIAIHADSGFVDTLSGGSNTGGFHQCYGSSLRVCTTRAPLGFCASRMARVILIPGDSSRRSSLT